MRLVPFEQRANLATIIGLDPGSQTLGLSVLTFDVTNLELVSTQAQTFVGIKLPHVNPWEVELHQERIARINAHGRNLLDVFNHYMPIQIACESPFYSSRMPSAFQALLEVMAAVKGAMSLYDPWRQLYTIDPPTVKKAVGAMGNAGKEDVMKAMLKKEAELRIVGGFPLACYDEHSIDAIAVAYCRLTGLRNSIF